MVGDTAVSVCGGTLVAVGGSAVLVVRIRVAVGGAAVLVGGTAVFVGGTAVGGTAVFVGTSSVPVGMMTVGTTLVAVDGTSVAVPEDGVSVAGVTVAVGGIGVRVGTVWRSQFWPEMAHELQPCDKKSKESTSRTTGKNLRRDDMGLLLLSQFQSQDAVLPHRIPFDMAAQGCSGLCPCAVGLFGSAVVSPSSSPLSA